jgi:hypothetical protein
MLNTTDFNAQRVCLLKRGSGNEFVHVASSTNASTIAYVTHWLDWYALYACPSPNELGAVGPGCRIVVENLACGLEPSHKSFDIYLYISRRGKGQTMTKEQYQSLLSVFGAASQAPVAKASEASLGTYNQSKNQMGNK